MTPCDQLKSEADHQQQGLLISRIDPSDEYQHRTLWKCTAPLLLHELPEHPMFYMDIPDKDQTVTCISLEGVTGVTVAHCHGKIAAFHMHRKNEDSSYVYQQAHEFVTWMHCPLDDEESIVSMWLIHHSSDGSGLIVGIPRQRLHSTYGDLGPNNI